MIDSGDTQPLPIRGHQSAPSRSGRTIASPSHRRRAIRWTVSIVVSLGVIIIAGIGGITGLIYLQARIDEARQVDAIVVMGAAQYNGRPSPVLEARLEHALVLYERGYAPEIVVTGGKQSGDAFTEARASADYLIERGVPESSILLENEGRSTWESMQGVPALLAPDDGTRVLVVSDGFHLFRSEMMLRTLGYKTFASAAPDSPITPWSVPEFAYVIRETGGVLAFLLEYLW